VRALGEQAPVDLREAARERVHAPSLGIIFM
jgi:hypothetical protein